MLRDIRIEDFGPHKRWRGKPGPGVNLIVGANGTGKSNIVCAIGWALLGAKALPYNQSIIINDDATSCSVAVDIDLMGVLHSFYRSFDGRSVEARVVKDGEVVAETASGVEEYLTSVGLDWDAFSVLFSRQKDLDQFIDALPSERKKIFDSLLRMEAVMAAAKKCKDMAAKALSEKPRILFEDEDWVFANAVGTAEAVEETIRGVELAEQILDTRLEDYETAKAVITGVDQDQLSSIHKLLAEAGNAVAAASKDLKDLKTVAEKCNKSSKGVVESITKLDSDNSGIQTNIAVNEDTVKLASQNISNISGQLAALGNLRELLSDGSACPLCGKMLDNAEETKEKMAGGIETLLKARDDSQEVHNIAMRRITLLQREELEYDNQKQSLSDLLTLAETAERARDALDKALKRVEKAEKDRKKVQEVADSFGTASQDDVNDFQIAECNYNSATNDLFDAKTALASAEREEQAAKTVLDKYEKAKVDYSKNTAVSATFLLAEKNLKKFRDQALQDALEWVMVRATQIWRSAGAIEGLDEDARIELDAKLNFWIVSSEKKIPVYRLSGGQKATFSISLRIALSDFLSERLGLHGLLILDAAFDSIDERNRDVVGQALDFAGVDQALVFSHFDIENIPAKRFIL